MVPGWTYAGIPTTPCVADIALLIRAKAGADPRDRVRVEPHLCRQSQPVVSGACGAVLRETRVALGDGLRSDSSKINWDFATSTGRPFYDFAYGAAAAEVAVDTLTGELRVLLRRSLLFEDCGRSLNPAIDLGQIEGAFVQGMGWLTTEELWWDGEGRLRTHGPSTYNIPGSRDVPPSSMRASSTTRRIARRRSSTPRRWASCR